MTDWMTPLAILVAGLIAGTMIIYLFGRRRTIPPDLRAVRDALLEQIRNADGDERLRLELEAAEVLRQMDRVPPASGRPSRRLPAGAFAAGAGTVLAIVAIAYLVNKSATTRQPQQPQQTAQAVDADSALQTLEANVRREPDDLKSRVELARAYIERNNLVGVFEQTQYVLAKSPDDSRALTYEAIVRMNMGDSTSAKQMLQRALQTDPEFLDAYVTAAWLLTQRGEAAEAKKMMDEALRRHPEEKGRLQPVFDEMQSHPAAPVAPAAAPGSAVRVTVSIDDAHGDTSGVVFVIARSTGGSAGHPVAVKRIELQSLPATFDLGDSDTMMGQPLPQTMRIEARLDRDGDVTTRSAADPVAMQDGVAAGSSIKLALK